MLSKKLENALNEQINAEFWSAYLYLSMSAQRLHRHGAEGHGHLLPGGQQHIHLPVGGKGIDFISNSDSVLILYTNLRIPPFNS